MSFNNLKKNMGMNGLKNIQNELEKLNKGNNNNSADDRYWKLTSDKSGVGAAIIRFLPESEGDSTPWILLYEHAFQGPGGWYIEKSLTTINGKDPVSEYNSELWNSGIDANKDIARKQKRNARYISNILVIKDPANPENEGKVFLFKYGKKIFDKIKGAMFPENDPVDQKDPMNPFCPWTGANFKLKSKRVDGYISYDSSEFSAQEALFDSDDSKIEALWKTQHKLSDLIDASQFKSYEQLKARLDKVIGLKTTAQTRTVESKPEAQSVRESISESAETKSDYTSSFSDDDISDDLDYLQALANEE